MSEKKYFEFGNQAVVFFLFFFFCFFHNTGSFPSSTLAVEPAMSFDLVSFRFKGF